MTPAARRAAIAALGWTQRGLAAVLRYPGDGRQVRRWFAPGGTAPAEIDAWLERRAQAMRDDPPPAIASLPPDRR